MKVSRYGLAAALVWLLVVAVGSTVVWAVISRAGDELVAGADPAVGSTSTPTVSDSGSPSATASRSARPHHKPTTSHPATSTSTSAPAPTSHATTSAPSTPKPSSHPTHHPSKHPTSSAPSAVRRTWQGTGGLVVAECQGGSVSLYSASPNSGFSIDIGSRGPSRVEVEFKGRGEKEGVKVEVTSHCSGGAPVFSAERSGGGDDGGGGGDDGGGDDGGGDG